MTYLSICVSIYVAPARIWEGAERERERDCSSGNESSHPLLSPIPPIIIIVVIIIQENFSAHCRVVLAFVVIVVIIMKSVTEPRKKPPMNSPRVCVSGKEERS